MKIIEQVIAEHNLPVTNYDLYTGEIAKIKQIQPRDRRGKLVVVTAMNPNPAGEGKTTNTIGLVDGLNKIGLSTIGVLREPSMGTVFGMKGTGSGSNKAVLLPFDKINLHFTGDLHAITSANNLIAAVLDNEVYQKSPLDINPNRIFWKRCLDVNDRSLRDVNINGGKTSFNITAASDLMALFCLAKTREDFFTQLDNTIVAETNAGEPVWIKDLEIREALEAILQDAFYPNLVRTLENNPFLVHGGPFANIAHGCSSVIAGEMAMQMADVVVTECGFGSDLGLEKMFDITCQAAGWTPSLVCLVVSLKSIHFQETTPNNLTGGFDNIAQHLSHLKKYGVPFICLINSRPDDVPAEMEQLQNWLREQAVPFAVANAWSSGSTGMVEAAQLVKKTLDSKPVFAPLYRLNQPLETKIQNIVRSAYGGKGVIWSEQAANKLKELKRNDYYVCFAKTPYSLTDNPKIKGRPKDFMIQITDLEVNEAANLLILISGVIFRMPGLPKVPAAKKFVWK